MSIPSFPNFAPVSFDQKDELIPFFKTVKDGMCENTFASIYLDSNKYEYEISKFSNTTYILLGREKKGTSCRFCSILGKFPTFEEFQNIFLDHRMPHCCYMKNISKEVIENNKEMFSKLHMTPQYDINNSYYIYNKKDLAELKGKAFSKKKNLVNQFNKAYKGTVQILNDENLADAISVLNTWKDFRIEQEESDGDFYQCNLALQKYKELQLSGVIVYANNTPVGFSLGETIGNNIYDVHFEKGIYTFHGVYQYLNQQTALSLPENITLINREQDLGDEGLRQAKLSYRPCCMIEKYKASLSAMKTNKIN
jgi:hypothetical protein